MANGDALSSRGNVNDYCRIYLESRKEIRADDANGFEIDRLSLNRTTRDRRCVSFSFEEPVFS